METAIDPQGRIVIPQVIRDHLGIKAGTVFQVQEHNEEIVLTPVSSQSPTALKQNVLVFTGEATEDISQAVELTRHNRIQEFMK